MDGLRIQLPYTGHKLTQGYLKKETAQANFLMKKSMQMRYCLLDLTRFMFKYAKAPTEVFTQIHLKDIIDITIEKDPIFKIEKSFFGKNIKEKEGFKFII